jgi:hypothetical protein
MGISTSSENYQVNFNGTSVTLPFSTTINVNENLNSLIFTLNSTIPSGSTAIFNNPPIQSAGAGETIPSYLCYSLINNNQSFVIADLDNLSSGNANQSYRFFIGVSYTPSGGKASTFWSTDPTIVNTPVT